MAYDEQYGSSRQNSVLGLASSHSYLDGVPFKISPIFRPPKQPVFPPDVVNTGSCEAFHEEYEYDTEEAVLAWARAREEAKVKAIAEREAAERARAALAAAESNSSSDSDEDAPEVPQHPVATTQPSQPPPVAAKPPPWQLPVSVSNTILTPVQAGKAKVQSPLAPHAQVDLALFEQEGDPFDNLELQTINEMEELRTLLDGTNMGGASEEPSPNPDNQATSNNVETENCYSNISANAVSSGPVAGTASVVASSANDVYENVVMGPTGITVVGSEQSVSAANTAAASDPASSDSTAKRNSSYVIEPTGDGDYVQIRPDYGQQTVSFQKDSGPIYGNVGQGAEPSLGGELPEQYSNSKVFKAVLPPIPRPRGHSLGGDPAPEGAAGSTVSTAYNAADQSSLPSTNGRFGFAAGGMSQSAYVMSASASGVPDMSRSDYSGMNPFHTYSNLPASNPTPVTVNSSPSPAFSNNIYSRYVNSETVSAGGAADREALRNAKSNPDLSVLGQVSPNAGSSQSSSPQPWNPYKPLPPTPVSELRSSSSSTESLPTDQHHSNNTEVDPYNSLSSEAKNFVNNLTSMGFSRSRASRAVEKFGADQKEVLDHLLNVDKLVEKKFTPTQAETGLQLFKNDIKKAEQFLDLYQQFTELGFTGERIQTALIKHQLDRDKALDYLTA
ncbi:ubiquitin-associated protein 1-like isoform X2 [Littorina saxatilis]|uniref:Ubiquitin-associated protein 1 n=1 Tax=Littorina saxatilis TaxID=31220 RepID=A0AAN9C2G4_9CAEN